ncbi:MAG: hypothetical protein ABF780_03355 [Bifidobacterium aquikefiri]|nr:hypothetical protein [Bifidobacterium aquikefiri]
MHAADVDAVAFIEFEAACTRLVEVSVESGIVSLSVKADPLEGFDSHAILFSQEIDVKRYPKQRGEEMDNELRKLLTQLYEKLFAMCGVPQLIPETLGEVTS